MKLVTQPSITKRELNRISKYLRDRSNGVHKPFITAMTIKQRWSNLLFARGRMALVVFDIQQQRLTSCR
ncbi:hypothetical protein MCT03_00525 [Vibrio aestuarianus]|nr:hypothetical protein [Vibrio aestuarianus]MDE1222862.1 hypothetical protein [Vibrio aestuarianus]CAH8241531.1 hypothetical protein VAE122_300004 [Vibrio aestuarianus]